MSDGPAPQDQGALNFARGVGQPTDNTKPATSMQEFIEQLFEQVVSWVSKGTGVKLSSFMSTGMFGGNKIEDLGIKTGNSIMSASLVQGPQGGALASAFSVFKWWDAGGPSAPPIEAASGGGGGWGGDGGGGGGSSGGGQAFESYVASNPGMGEMFIAAGGGNRFVSNDVSWGDLGGFSPPTIGGGMGQGMGMSV